MGFGKVNYSSDKKFAKRLKLKDGDTIFRIGPPIKSLAASGRWFLFKKQHFGYFVPNPKVGEADIPAPWECVEEKRRDGMIVHPCEECNDIRQKKDLQAERVVQAKAKKLSAEETKTLMGPLTAWLKTHNCDKKYWINAILMDRSMGMMGLPWSVYDGITKKIDKLREMGIDPIDPAQGVWWKVTRTGDGFNTDYTVDYVEETETVNGKKFNTPKLAPLSEEDEKRAEAEFADLPTDVVRAVTDEQRAAIRAAGVDSEAVGRILGMGTRTERSREASPERPEEPETPASEAPPAEQVTAPAALPTASPEIDEEAEMMAKLEALRAAKKAASKPAAAKAEPPPSVAAAAGISASAEKPKSSTSPVPTNTKAISDEDFLAMFNTDNK